MSTPLLIAKQGWRQRPDDPALGDGPVVALADDVGEFAAQRLQIDRSATVTTTANVRYVHLGEDSVRRCCGKPITSIRRPHW
jgi:hypothetical protein